MEAAFNRIFDKYASRKDVHSAVFRLESLSRSMVWERAAGQFGPQEGQTMTASSPYFMASITKLYVTALILRLGAEGRISLDDPFVKCLPAGRAEQIHVIKGVDRSHLITVRQLLAHTSGLPDYFEQPSLDGDIFAEPIIRPLGVQSTYLFRPQTIADFAHVASIWSGTVPLAIPRAMASFGADGGIVSTAREGIIFLGAFLQGALFPTSYLAKMMAWNPIFFPLEYGVGIMRFKLPWFFSPFKPVPAAIGHSGASGAVLFYCPDCDVIISGTVNQVQNRSLPYRLMTELISSFRS